MSAVEGVEVQASPIPTSRCGSCHAPIFWTLSTTGKSAPVDVEPDVERGNVLLSWRPRLGVALSVVLSGAALLRARRRGEQLRTNHWATCPDRAEWRARTDAKRRGSGR